MTEQQYAPASRNIATEYSLSGALRFVLAKFLGRVDDMLPAQIVSYNRTTNLASVQPLINMVTTDNIVVVRKPINSVPVFQYSGGGFVISFPIKAGDFGWIKANDRDISLFKQTSQASPPNTKRKHSFSDAMFIPQAAWNLITVAENDANNMVIQNYAGTVKISISETGIGINGPANPNAVFDIQSETKAFAPPRMTTTQKLAIPSPQIGFMVYDITELAISTYNGSSWS